MKRFFPLLLFSLAIALFCGSSSCGDDPPAKPTVKAAPLDTTSHEFSWSYWQIGDWGSSTLFYDLFALSPDFVIAVGRINDSSQYPRVNNCYIWDGVSLNPFSLPINNNDTVTINSEYRSREINSIWMFRRDNFWYAMDNKGTYSHLTIASGDTNLKTENSFVRADVDGAIGTRIWAQDTSDIFFGGSHGDVMRYQNGIWTRYNIQTSGNWVKDLWGTSPDNVFMCAHSEIPSYFYRFDGNKWNLIWTDAFGSLADSVQFGLPQCVWGLPNDDSIWIAGLWLGRMKNDGSGKVRVIKSVQPHGIRRIRGNKWNNVFFIGGIGAIWHYNGNTIHVYTDFYRNNWELTALAVFDNDVFIAGYVYGGGAIFIHGKRKK